MSETFREQLSRVVAMADGDLTWDLSDNDIAALKAILAERKRLIAKLTRIHELAVATCEREGYGFEDVEDTLAIRAIVEIELGVSV